MTNLVSIFKVNSGSLKIASFILDAEANVDIDQLNNGPSTLESIMQILGLLVLFIVIIIASYFVTRWIGNVSLNGMNNRNFKVIETFRVSQTKYMQIICVADEYFLIAVCKENISLIGKLDGSNVILQDETKKMKTFKEILDDFSKKKNS